VPLSPREPAPALRARIAVAGLRRLLVAPGSAPPADPCGADVAPMPDEAGGGAGAPAPPDDAPAALVFTSGSTGTPRAALLSHGALRWSARGVCETLAFGEASAWALALPLHHVGGMGVVVRALVAGGGLVVPAPDEPLAAVLAHKAVTHASLVATQLGRLLREAPGVLAGRTLLLGGSALPPPLLDDAHARGLHVIASYGLTEMASTVTATAPGADRAALATAGRVLPYRDVRLSDSGEILVGGPTRFSGYVTETGLATPFDAEGYFATGDLGHFDEAGRLVVHGRRDLMFVSGGENIHPEAIERALLALPGVEEAVVVPVPDAEFGTRPFAFVRSSALDADRLRAELRAHLPGYLIPVGVAPLPETQGLKPQRKALAGLAQKVRVTRSEVREAI
jgi:o-succinylbenzoate---CoA ligase